MDSPIIQLHYERQRIAVTVTSVMGFWEQSLYPFGIQCTQLLTWKKRCFSCIHSVFRIMEGMEGCGGKLGRIIRLSNEGKHKRQVLSNCVCLLLWHGLSISQMPVLSTHPYIWITVEQSVCTIHTTIELLQWFPSKPSNFRSYSSHLLLKTQNTVYISFYSKSNLNSWKHSFIHIITKYSFDFIELHFK